VSVAVRYTNFDGRPVSEHWAAVLPAARAAGVRFTLNSGHRTFAQQAALRAAYERYRSGRGPWAPLAARPAHSAPHIRTGRQDHAIDVRYDEGGARRLAAWLRSKGCRVAFTVAGEPWHMEVPAADLARLARALGGGGLEVLDGFERRLVRELDHLRRVRRGTARRRELVAALTRRRKAIWRAAQGRGGWQANRRRARYAILLDRTRRR
jgi:hypothetical protein